MSLVEAYLADLGRRLGRSFPKQVAEARLREARAHLEEAARIEGEAAALRRFGTPAENARAIVRQARGYDARGAWALSWGAGLGILAGLLTPLALSRSLPHLWRDQALVWPWLPFLAALAFGARCLRTRRWLVGPAAFWAGLAVAIAVVATFASDAGSSSESRANAVTRAEASLRQAERDAGEVAEWRSGRPPSRTVPYAMATQTVDFVVGLPVPLHGRGERAYDAHRYATPQPGAAEAWSTFGAGWARTVELRRAWAAESLATARSGPRASEIAQAAARAFARPFLQMALVLLAFNALALALGRLADAAARPARRVGL